MKATTRAVVTCFLVVGLAAGCGGGNSASSPMASGAVSSGSGPTPLSASGHYVTSSPYPSAGPQPFKFLVTAPQGPIPPSLQPYEVWPFFDSNNQAYFALDVSATGPWGAWTPAQLQAMTVAAINQTGWIISTVTSGP